MVFKNFLKSINYDRLNYLKHDSINKILKDSGLAKLDDEGNVIGVKQLKAKEHFGTPKKAIIEGLLDLVPGYNLFRAYKDKKNKNKVYRALSAIGAEFSNIPLVYPTASYIKEALNHVSLHTKFYKQALEDQKEFLDLDSKVKSFYNEGHFSDALPIAQSLNENYLKGYIFLQAIESKIEFDLNKKEFQQKELSRKKELK